jgi:hypothetical protein
MIVSFPIRLLVQVGLVLLALFGLVAFAHTPVGRPLLARLGAAAGCPVNLDAVDPAKVEAYRTQQLAQRRGVTREASHAALIFELGTTRRADVLAWSQRSGASCRAMRQDSVLQCHAVPAEALLEPATAPRVDNLHLQFDSRGRLVAIDLFRMGGSGSAALAWVEARDRDLEQRVGKATSAQGEHNSDYLGARSWNRVAKQYRYRNYVAEVSAMNFGQRGVRVREQYQWLDTGA